MQGFKNTGFYYLMLALLLDLVTPYLLGFFYPDLNQMTQVISLFGEVHSPVRLAFLFLSVLSGCLYVLAIPAIFSYFKYLKSPFPFLSPLAIAAYGIGDSIFTGIFSIRSQTGPWDFSTWVHLLGSGLGYTAFLLFPLFVLLNCYSSKNKNNLYTFRILLGLNLLSALAYGIARFPMLSQGTIFSPLGFWQRVSFFFNDLAIFIFAIQALKKPSHPVTKPESF